jgi:hypothetical protein
LPDTRKRKRVAKINEETREERERETTENALEIEGNV